VKRFQRAQAIVAFSIDRMRNWSTSEDNDLQKALAAALKAEKDLASGVAAVALLAEKNWTPPKKSLALVFSPGELVQIASKYRVRYRDLYSAAVMSNLQVVKASENGEIVVKSSDLPGHPSQQFYAVKSHLQRRASKDQHAQLHLL
jgi:hypothetical protein